MRTYLAASILLTSFASWAAWDEVAQDGVARVYVDLSSVKAPGGVRRVWVLYELKQKDADGELSRRDCKRPSVTLQWGTLAVG